MSGCLCNTSVAIIVSGQLSRFTYLSTFARLPQGVNSLLWDTEAGCGPVAVDAFLVLDASPSAIRRQPDVFSPGVSPVNLNVGRVDHARAVTAPNIQRVWRGAGCHAVHVRMLARSQIDMGLARMQAVARAAGAKATGAANGSDWWRAVVKSPRFSASRWRPNGRMLYLRHVALTDALAAGESYGWFLYFREDTMFFMPPARLARSACRAKGTLAHVVHDRKCSFGGVADKTFWANRNGAALLFGATPEDFGGLLASWVQRALEGTKANDAMQTETMYKRIIDEKSASSEQQHINRLDVRGAVLAGGAGADVCLCVNALYWSCGRRVVAANYSGLGACQDKDLGRAEYFRGCGARQFAPTWEAYGPNATSRFYDRVEAADIDSDGGNG